MIMKSARTIPVTEKTEIDPEIAKIGEPYDKETQAWLGRAIGESAEELTAQRLPLSRQRDHRSDSARATGSGQRRRFDGRLLQSNGRTFPKAQVTVRDIAGLYEYENTLVTVELTGQQLKDALEHSARYFKEYQPGKSLNDLVDSRIPGFNFDVAQGVNYDIDLTKPIRPAHSEPQIQRPAFVAGTKAARRHEQLSGEWRRRLHDVQRRAGHLSLQCRSARVDYRLGRKEQDSADKGDTTGGLWERSRESEPPAVAGG